MKRLLLPLLAALALPTAVNAETYWLVLGHGHGDLDSSSALEKIEMSSIEACEKQGEKWAELRRNENGAGRIFKGVRNIFYACLTGK